MYGFCIARSISDGVIDKPIDNINIPSADCITDRDIVDPIKDGFCIANPAASIVHRGDNAQNFFETSANDILLSLYCLLSDDICILLLCTNFCLVVS